MSKLDGIKLTKIYYSIGEVASIFDVNTSLIRFWEKEFTVIQPKKNKKGNRLFTVKDIEHFNKIYQLVKEQGYTLDGAKKALKQKDSKSSPSIEESTDLQLNPSSSEVIARLEQVKQQLIDLKNGKV